MSVATKPRRAHVFELSSGKLLKTTPVFDMYWRFAKERQDVFFRRVSGEARPWTSDPYLLEYRFTNPYRASDRVSQFLIHEVIYKGSQTAEEVVFRTLLFKLFNRIDTWKLLMKTVGPITWADFDRNKYTAVLERSMSNGNKIYSPAYIMPSPMMGQKRKHANHLILLEKLMNEKLPRRIRQAPDLRGVFEILMGVHSLGEFLAFQFAIDLNYGPVVNFSEMDFVVAGPGAKSGIKKSFIDIKGLSEEELIGEVAKAADREFCNRGLTFRTLWGRPLQLIDCQNLFCEIDKYSRVAFPRAMGSGRTRIKRKFAPSESPLPQWYPPKWGLNTKN